MKIHIVAAARPNFMKIAPLYHALKKEKWAEPIIVHTGQHYDFNMSDAFFQDFNLPAPHIHLGVGSGTHAEQTGNVMIAYEKVLTEQRPDLLIVVGDVNSTMATTIAASKLSVKTAHLEAGLRSFDMTMPEEINRLVTDRLADRLWTPSPDGDENLIREGVSPEKIERVGNIMIDSFEMLKERIENERVFEEFGFRQGEYGVVTLHRPANVDNPDSLKALCETLNRISEKLPLIFPIHPRTSKRLEETGLKADFTSRPNITFCEPQSYIRFMSLVTSAKIVITDSGGVQEETTYLKIPCMTLRPNTERPVTVTEGSNRLCTIDNVEKNVNDVLNGNISESKIPDLWDGRTAGRVVAAIRKMHES